MDDDLKADQQRDALLHQLLKTPPQPRPKRDRGAKPKLPSGGVESKGEPNRATVPR
jgi:hypothetical protein